jgi:hypothetical protein
LPPDGSCGKLPPAGTETAANLELDRAAIIVAAAAPRIEEDIISLDGLNA